MNTGQSGDHWCSAKASPRRSIRTACKLRASGSSKGPCAGTNVCGMSCGRCCPSPLHMQLHSPMHAALAKKAAAGHQQRRPLQVCFHCALAYEPKAILSPRRRDHCHGRRQQSVGPQLSAITLPVSPRLLIIHLNRHFHSIACTHLVLHQLYNHERSLKRQAASAIVECISLLIEFILALSDVAASERSKEEALAVMTPGRGNAMPARLPAGFSFNLHQEQSGVGKILRVSFRPQCLRHKIAPSLASPSALRSFLDKHAACRHAPHPLSNNRPLSFKLMCLVICQLHMMHLPE